MTAPFDYLAGPEFDPLPFTRRRPLLAGFLFVVVTVATALLASGHAMVALWMATMVMAAPDRVAVGLLVLAVTATAGEVFVAWVLFERTMRHLEAVWGAWVVRCPRDPSALVVEGWGS